MKKLPVILLALLALAFTSCLEEEVLIERPVSSEFELPDNPVDLSRTDAAELVGEKFGMANITLSNATNSTNFSMIGCELSVLEAGEPNDPAISRIDEAGSTFAFGNVIEVDPLDSDQNTITFSKLSTAPTSGEWSWFLETSVFPIVADAPLKVSRVGDNLVISCTECPMQYEGRTYTDREVILSLAN